MTLLALAFYRSAVSPSNTADSSRSSSFPRTLKR
jgi:hypothetical protein